MIDLSYTLSSGGYDCYTCYHTQIYKMETASVYECVCACVRVCVCVCAYVCSDVVHGNNEQCSPTHVCQTHANYAILIINIYNLEYYIIYL